ncbi:MAG: DUF1016 N-terminal domain-containing protein [Desulfobacterales bacterium]
MGRIVVERQADAEPGAAIAETTGGGSLRRNFAGITGFFRRNVTYLREYYPLYRDDERVQPPVAQLGWTHNRLTTDLS